jgi:succinyl-diaminopimelate desuccinylase
VGRIEGGTNTNVVPGKVVFKLDRRMIPEENPVEVEANIRKVIADAAAREPGITVEIKRLLLANSMKPLAGNQPLVEAIQKHGRELFGEEIPAMGTPLYTDVRLYGEAGIPGVIYGAGPRTVLESHAKRATSALVLEDLRRATKVVARTLSDLLLILCLARRRAGQAARRLLQPQAAPTGAAAATANGRRAASHAITSGSGAGRARW